MRSFHRTVSYMAAVSLVVAACGGDDGGGPDNQAPTAAFTSSCNALACTFTDASTDPDGATDIESWDWDFGGDGESQDQSPAHTFSAAGTYDVSLTVTDAAGATNSVTHQVTVSTTPGNQAPTAAFTVDCASLECTFTDASTDPEDGTATSWEWDFGDPTSPDNTSTEQNPTHTYSVTELTEVTVTLTVTDADGAEATTTETFDVSPTAELECEDGSPNCELPIENDATVIATLTSSDCELSGNTFAVTITPPSGTPVDETIFTDGCNVAAGTEFPLQNGDLFVAGTVITARLISGGQNLALPPALRVRAGSAYPTWTLEFDDGAIGPETDPAEPDFNDLVITITATEP
ncbi:MAG TPA: PKD domain-containing protein [Gemmatimonadales bacterium]